MHCVSALVSYLTLPASLLFTRNIMSLVTTTITLQDPELTVGETTKVTIDFNGEYYTGLEAEDLHSEHGTFSNLIDNEGMSWTALFTPNPGESTRTAVITLSNTVLGGASSDPFTIDTQRPTVQIIVADEDIQGSESSLVTIKFNEEVRDFDVADLHADNGEMSNLVTSDEGRTWTATFTPYFDSMSATNKISLNTSFVRDVVGNLGENAVIESNNFSINMGPAGPTATVAVDDIALKSGEQATVTITFSEQVRNFDATDITVGNGVLSNLDSSDEGKTWTATVTPSAGVQDSTNVVSVNLAGVIGADSELAGTGTANSQNYSVDTKAPTATIVVDDTALAVGETSSVKIVFSEAIQHLDVSDFTVEGGTLTNLINDEGVPTSWSATFTPTVGIEATGRHITLNNTLVKDHAGNAGAGGTQSNAYAIDTKAPTVDISISDTNVGLDETAIVTVKFSDRVNSVDDYRVKAENGTLSTFATTDEGLTWTATFTPDANVALNDGYSKLDFNTAGLTDAAGNEMQLTSGTGYYQVNAAGPTATVTLEDPSLNSHETTAVSITFSEAVIGFNASAVTVDNGTLSALTQSDDGLTWKGILTPTAGVEDYSNVVKVNLGGLMGVSTGYAGNGIASSTNYTVDTKAPTATIVMSDNALTAGETAKVTITFSESVSNFDALDLKAENGTLGALSNSDEGRTWHTTFTPAADVNDATNVISLNMGGLSDWAGNHGVGITQSNNYTVGTTPPVVVTPTPTVTVDGVAIKKNTGTAADGSKTQVITVPTVTTGRVDKDGTAALADIPLVKATDGKSLLSVGVPVGFGVKASGSTTAKAADDSLTNLIAEIKAHSTAGSAAQESMVGGGTGFLGTLANSPLLVQTIVVSAPGSTDVSKGAMVVSGNADAGTAQTALVIDAKSLPAGATIELQNVDFAAIMGAVTLRGGEGKQVIFGDAASQDIFLGADDDILHGGAGNDIVGSAGGNDQIFGDEGDDIVFGGEGNDIIDGGTGYDIVKLVGAGRDDYSFRVDDGKLVVTHLNGGIDGTDIVSNVEALRFTGSGANVDVAFRDTDVASLVRMYETAFDRNADEGGLNFWIGQSEAGLSLHDIAEAMVTSTEAQAHFKGMSDAAFIQALYLQGLDRTGSAQESKIWIDSLEAGVVSRGTALLGFADSAEKIALVGFMDTSITTA